MGKLPLSFIKYSQKFLLTVMFAFGHIPLSVQADESSDVDFTLGLSKELTFFRYLDSSNTEKLAVEKDYINWYGSGDNGYERLYEIGEDLKKQLVDRFKDYSAPEKKELLRQIRLAGGIHFAANLQDRQGEHNYYEYNLNIDLDPEMGKPDSLEIYFDSSVTRFCDVFRNYVENKQGEGWTLVDYLKLTATIPEPMKLPAISRNLANALGVNHFNFVSEEGKSRQIEIVNQMLAEASLFGGDLAQSPLFVRASYRLAEQSPGFANFNESEQQEAAAKAGNTIIDWIKQERIIQITHAQNRLKDNPLTPDILFLQELANAMGVSLQSLPSLARKKNWEEKSAFDHFSNEDSLYQFLNALVPNLEYWSSGGPIASFGGTRANSKRKGKTKQQIIDLFYSGLEVVDEAKKASFLHTLDLAFDINLGRTVAPAAKDSRSALNYDVLPEFLKNFPIYFEKKRELLATDIRNKYRFLEAKKIAIREDKEVEFNALYEAFKQSNPDADPGAIPKLDQLRFEFYEFMLIGVNGLKFYNQLIAATEKDDFKALSTNKERRLRGIAEVVEFVLPGIGSLVAAPIHASVGDWTSFGTSLGSGLADIVSLGTSKMATSVGNAAKMAALKAGKTSVEAVKAGNKAAKAFLKSSKARVVDISATTIGTTAEAIEFGRGVDALINAKTPEERYQAIMGLITASAMAAPTPMIYAARKLSRKTGSTELTPMSTPGQPARQGSDSLTNKQPMTVHVENGSRQVEHKKASKEDSDDSTAEALDIEGSSGACSFKSRKKRSVSGCLSLPTLVTTRREIKTNFLERIGALYEEYHGGFRAFTDYEIGNLKEELSEFASSLGKSRNADLQKVHRVLTDAPGLNSSLPSLEIVEYPQAAVKGGGTISSFSNFTNYLNYVNSKELNSLDCQRIISDLRKWSESLIENQKNKFSLELKTSIFDRFSVVDRLEEIKPLGNQIEPVSSQLNDLKVPSEIEDAIEKSHQIEHEHAGYMNQFGLDTEQFELIKNAIKDYTVDSSAVNRYARGQPEALGSAKSRMEKIDKIFELFGGKGFLDKERTVYRFAKYKTGKGQVSPFGNSIKQGDVISDKAFVSTSEDKHFLYHNGSLELREPDDVIVRFVIEGSGGANISGSSSYNNANARRKYDWVMIQADKESDPDRKAELLKMADENRLGQSEILFPRNTQFFVREIEVQNSGKDVYVSLQVISDDTIIKVKDMYTGEFITLDRKSI